MNILICNSHDRLTGVTTFNYTLAKKLIEEGHKITFYLNNLESKDGIVINKFKEIGDVYYYQQNPIGLFDYIIFSDSISQYRFEKIDSKKIFIVHGLMEEYIC